MTLRKPMSKKLRFEIFKRDGFACQYCGAKAPEVRLHVDHIVPVAKGGEDEMSNLTTACVDCNHGKAANFHDPLLQRINYLEGQLRANDALLMEYRDAIWHFKEKGLRTTEHILRDFDLDRVITDDDFNRVHEHVWKLGYVDAADEFAIAAHVVGEDSEARVVIESAIAHLARASRADIAGYEAVLA